jgi:hypothetical protein
MKQIVPLEGAIQKDSRTHKFYKKEYFTWWYDEEALSNILKPAKGLNWVAQSELIHSLFEDAKKLAKKQNKKHQWTYVEDNFIRCNYEYLSDNVIGLALNIPSRWVRIRRMVLGLKKNVMTETYKVVVWCERKAFEEDVKAFKLNGTLPDKQRQPYVGI